MKKAHIQKTDGRLLELEFDSPCLKDNPLNDPWLRRFQVWLPPDYDAAPNKTFPIIFQWPGYTGTGANYTAWQGFSDNVPDRLNRMHFEQAMGSAIVVFPDTFTAYGGNQFINSSAVGNYADYFLKELIPFLEKELKVNPGREHRACFGHSSGGYGAIIHGMQYAPFWNAIAMHAGDSAFLQVFPHLWQQAATHLTAFIHPTKSSGIAEQIQPCLQDDGRIKRFLDYVWQAPMPTRDDTFTLMSLGLAAFFDPNPDAPNGFNVPMDLNTGEQQPQRWQQWQQHDPVHLVKTCADNLKTLKALYIDCGWRDQYLLHFGARQLVQQLAHYNVPYHYEEFDGSHSGTQHRFEVSLPMLYKAIQ